MGCRVWLEHVTRIHTALYQGHADARCAASGGMARFCLRGGERGLGVGRCGRWRAGRDQPDAAAVLDLTQSTESTRRSRKAATAAGMTRDRLPTGLRHSHITHAIEAGCPCA